MTVDTDTAAAPGRGRPRDEHTDETILATTLQLLKDVGYRHLSVEAVAAAAGVAKTTIYRRYRNKADLATAALATMTPVEPLARPSDDPRRDLVAFLEEFEEAREEVGVDVIGSLLEDRGHSEFLDLHRQRIIDPRKRRSRQLLHRAQELDMIRPDADLDLVMELLIGSFFARHLAGRTRPPRWAETAVDTLWKGLEIRP
ncbi:MAG TPA: TetR-like C-terminal domain-containing protein [Acidimicrobiales bacterium]|nr:TetR-like C-terminal domain-containing protein [Acidimicrobiales bacterium]